MKFITILLTILTLSTAQTTNLVTTKNWTLTSGSIDGFSRNGNDSENIRIYGETPYASQGVLWEAIPDATSGADGGWNKDFPIDHTKTYRSMVWIKRTGNQNGVTYFGCSPSNTLKLDGTPHTNPYYWVGDLPVLDRWYLIVSYVYGSGETKTSYSESAGVYDGVTGKKIYTATCYKNKVGATIQRHRTYLYYCTDTSVRQYFYAPRFEEVNGEEPSIQSLLPNKTIIKASGGSFSGNISFLENGDLTGSIHSNGTGEFKKLRVTQTPTADFVFEEDYNLRSLEKTEKFIKENKHLPEIPSAKEMKENGLDMSDFQIKLLQKIEELTLHMIEMKKENNKQNKIIADLQKANAELRKSTIKEGN